MCVTVIFYRVDYFCDVAILTFSPCSFQAVSGIVKQYISSAFFHLLLEVSGDLSILKRSFLRQAMYKFQVKHGNIKSDFVLNLMCIKCGAYFARHGSP